MDEAPYDELLRRGVSIVHVDYPTPDLGAPGTGTSFLKMHLRRIRRRLIGSLFDPRDLWVAPAHSRALELHRDYQFDVVVSSYGPPASHIVAHRVKRDTGIYWVADYRDLWADHVYPGAFPFSFITRIREDRVICSSDLISSTSIEWAELLGRRSATPTVVIENGFDSDRAMSPAPSDSTNNKKQILYTGTIYTGDRDPRPFLTALKELAGQWPNLDSKLQVSFYGDHERLGDLVSEFGVETIVELGPVITIEESLTLQKSADLLLFFDWNRPVTGFLTAKLYEYLFAGTPILAMGASKEMSASIVVDKFRAGVVAGDDVRVIKETLLKLLNDEPLAYHVDKKSLAQFTRKALAEKLLQTFLERIQSAKLQETANGDATVLLTVHGAEKAEHLETCLTSIRDQTRPAERIVLVKDGPLPKDLELVIGKFVKNELALCKIVELPENVGLVGALNEGLKHCETTYVLRMDSDDLSLPTRFERQIDFLEQHPEIGVISAAMQEFEEDPNDPRFIKRIHTEHADIEAQLPYRNPVNHAACCFRTRLVKDAGGYPDLPYLEDYKLWATLILKGVKFHNLQEPLYLCRYNISTISRRGGWSRFKNEIRLRWYLLRQGQIGPFVFTLVVLMQVLLRLTPLKVREVIWTIIRKPIN